MVTPLLWVSVGHIWGVKCWTPKNLQPQIVRRVATSGECAHIRGEWGMCAHMGWVRTYGVSAYIRGECIHMRWVCIVVLLFAMSPRATWPLLGVWEKWGEGSHAAHLVFVCLIYPPFVVVVCLCRSTAVGCHIVCLLCEKRNGGGKSLTGIGVDSDDMCRHCLDNMEHPVDAPGRVHSKQCASMSRWRHVATLSLLNPRKRVKGWNPTEARHEQELKCAG